AKVKKIKEKKIKMTLEKNIKSLVHFMAFPGPRLGRSTMYGEAPEKYMLDSINWIGKHGFFKGIEITLIKDHEIRQKVINLLKKYKFYITFCAQPIQLINEDNLIAETDISSIDELERTNAVNRLKSYLIEAYEFGASNFCFLSGKDPGTENGLRLRRQATQSLICSIHEICVYNKSIAKKLNKKPMKITLETFDRLSENNCKNQLIGPSDEARELAEIVRNNYGHDIFGILYDLGHMFLLRSGFDHEEVNVLRSLAPYLNFIHIANTITDKEHPQYGDSHVGMDHPDGAVTSEVLANFVKTLNEINYKNPIGFEFMPQGRQLSESVVNIAVASYKEAAEQIDVNYALGSYRFKTRRFLPEKIFYMITDYRLNRYGIIREEMKNRQRRERPWGENLIIIAADHPARRVTRVGENDLAMGDRQQYLGRILRVLIHNRVDGVMTTPDIMDDLFLINYFYKENGGESFLDNKILLGCTNRGGLSGSSYEMDDLLTAYTVEDIINCNLDGAKMMFRIDLETRQARYSQRTIEICSKIIRACNKNNIPAFVEPLPVYREKDGTYVVQYNADDIIKAIGIATALGGSSSNIWLKIPYVANFEQVVRSSSNPILMLGGESTGNPTDILENFERGLGAGPNVKGCLVGRNLLYPGFDDPYASAVAVSRILHDYDNTEKAVKELAKNRGKYMDFFTSIILGIHTEAEKEFSYPSELT
ncbi:MAG: hypothetical protein KAX10_02485, partial [Candidatus Lokiarchaeota archaeon]|nr:hypothetical protein [Candidatus Lokiarchaeota archaeon]